MADIIPVESILAFSLWACYHADVCIQLKAPLCLNSLLWQCNTSIYSFTVVCICCSLLMRFLQPFLLFVSSCFFDAVWLSPSHYFIFSIKFVFFLDPRGLLPGIHKPPAFHNILFWCFIKGISRIKQMLNNIFSSFLSSHIFQNLCCEWSAIFSISTL